ncbi:hypothetical protein MNBD_PLANCTO02-3184 [hydrothermal vent metagenome]|uniref:PDZ domain-containing protein n=1 Tax=hydrothermal vent metagenome TaxID=652676 RepID=A0A3B1DSL9_9ZZZZ
MNHLRANMLFLFVVMAFMLLQTRNVYSQANTKEKSPQTTAQTDVKSVAYWVNRLSHAKYSERERASTELIKAGSKASKRLQQQTKSKDLEVALRAVTILGEIYSQAVKHKDLKAFEETESVLTKIAFTHQRTVSALADAFLKNHPQARENFALRQIEKLGGIITWRKKNNSRADFPEGEEQKKISFILLGRKWKGNDENLTLFYRIPQLLTLMISGKGKKSPLSEKGIAFLERSFPQLKIQYRGSACLGVRGIDRVRIVPKGCTLNFVKPGSAAAAGGLLVGDTITNFGEKPVTNFQMLIDAISDFDPDDKVPVQIERGGTTKTLEITLQEWKQ